MLIKNLENPKYSLDNFEGPLTFLLYLVQKSEIDISEISLQDIILQYLEKLQLISDLNVEEGAEFISTTASLLWLKSKMLLPIHEQNENLEAAVEESPFVILPQIVEYLQFKQVSKELAEREQSQMGYYIRGQEFSPDSVKKPLGIEHISLQDLVSLFEKVLEKSSSQLGVIQEETWRVGDKIDSLRQHLQHEPLITFQALFSPHCCREELIVIFLAVLELMKLGDICVGKVGANGEICVVARQIGEGGHG